jgi:hypothetical protein
VRVRVFDIYQVRVELYPLDEGVYQVVAAGRDVCLVHFIREEQSRSWQCDCGRCKVGSKVEPLLIHVVTNHAKVSYREPWRTPQADVSKDARSLEETLTYLRLTGDHPDPTYEQAVVYSHSR